MQARAVPARYFFVSFLFFCTWETVQEYPSNTVSQSTRGFIWLPSLTFNLAKIKICCGNDARGLASVEYCPPPSQTFSQSGGGWPLKVRQPLKDGISLSSAGHGWQERNFISMQSTLNLQHGDVTSETQTNESAAAEIKQLESPSLVAHLCLFICLFFFPKKWS